MSCLITTLSSFKERSLSEKEYLILKFGKKNVAESTFLNSLIEGLLINISLSPISPTEHKIEVSDSISSFST